MTEQSIARKIQPGFPPSVAGAADHFIASLGGDARAAVIQLLVLVDSLQFENETLTIAASDSYMRATVRRSLR
jgi:hypothetical protein